MTRRFSQYLQHILGQSKYYIVIIICMKQFHSIMIHVHVFTMLLKDIASVIYHFL